MINESLIGKRQEINCKLSCKENIPKTEQLYLKDSINNRENQIMFFFAKVNYIFPSTLC